jgi:KDO2-lipid IV(A) lauroyltransferase
VPGGHVAYLAYRAGAETARRLPAPLGRPLARFASRAMALTSGGRRRQVARNLRRVLGSSLDDDALERATSTVFENYARYWYEMFRLGPDSSAELQRTFALRGGEHLDAALGAGGGAILALPHLGNWDVAGAWLAGRVGGVTVVAEAVEPPELFEWFVGVRRSIGMEVVPLGPDAGPAVVRALNRAQVVCLVADRDITGDGVEVEFFGETTRLPGGPATLALRTGAPLLPVGTYFRDDRHHCAWFGEPIPVERRGRLRDDVSRVTQELALRFEVLIRAAPEQWLMMQPNWPSDTDTVAAPGGRAPGPEHGVDA